MDNFDRICPGRYYADASLFINVAMVLHVFNITPPLDEEGRTIHIKPIMTNGTLSCVIVAILRLRVFN